LDEKNHQKAAIVVAVLITSCHVSLKSKIGPVSAQTIATINAIRKAAGAALTQAVQVAKWLKYETVF
jgi:hypothetical protein